MTSFKTIYIILLLCIPSLTLCMELPQEQIKQKFEPAIDEYSPQLTAKEIETNYNHIQIINAKNERKFIEYLNKNITNPDKEIFIIKNKLSNIQKAIDLQYSKIAGKINLAYAPFFVASQKNGNIYDNFWSYMRNISDQAIYVPQENEKQNLKWDIQADKEIPFYFLCMLKENLNRKNIPLSAVYFHYSDNNCYQSPRVLGDFDDDQLSITFQQPGSIDINKKNLMSISLDAQEGYCFATINNFNCTLNKLKPFLILNKVTNNNVNENDFSALTKRLSQIQFLTNALENQEHARILKNYLKEVYVFKFSIDDYKKIFKIDRLHRILTWLEKHTV